MSGSFGSLSSPSTMCRSVRQTPQVATKSSTCPEPGSGSGSSASRKGSRCRSRTIARIDSGYDGLQRFAKLSRPEEDVGGAEVGFAFAEKASFESDRTTVGVDQAKPSASVDRLAVEEQQIEAVVFTRRLEAKHRLVPHALRDRSKKAFATHRVAAGPEASLSTTPVIPKLQAKARALARLALELQDQVFFAGQPVNARLDVEGERERVLVSGVDFDPFGTASPGRPTPRRNWAERIAAKAGRVSGRSGGRDRRRRWSRDRHGHRCWRWLRHGRGVGWRWHGRRSLRNGCWDRHNARRSNAGLQTSGAIPLLNRRSVGRKNRPSGSDRLARRRERRPPARGDHDRVAHGHAKIGGNAQLRSNGGRRPRLATDQQRHSERNKQGDQREDRQPREPIPCRYRTRSDPSTIALDQTSS